MTRQSARVAGGCKGKKVREGPQQFDNGVQQAIWEACPTSRLKHNFYRRMQLLCDRL